MENNEKTYEKPTIHKAGSVVEKTLGDEERDTADLKEYYY
ncbi:lasso RiPP family leader peptide-containing protein [Paenactinomyces guangxiensis]|uniref:Lasso RiPP family leader peptide-containing protein n=1 Tax=Paenactinomyces guangxiensis TaxID=1490290 RepID=A0A7W1WPT4_9BACL|nr:lasso RiPP family leader peptide-containing protein [Paenactinomyces guangxiensis]MBA4493676.1 lasso RiPP family leader peptide-containing protein [Paenactinomyces guangxiensis]MBH8590963.1 lasso RiPP family leader peptide-containing protein [Paenactinomyces guangxiensis]